MTLKRKDSKYLFKALMVVVILLINLYYNFPINEQSYNVGILSEGYFDMDYPSYSQYGLRTIGMFGCLPDLLNVYGYDVTSVQRPVLSSDLSELNTLVVINVNYSLTDNEKNCIWSFVRDGGSLLVMADHTDLNGIMNYTNELLDPIDIKVNFDSTVPLKDKWSNGLVFFRHPITSNLVNNVEVKWLVGASLHIGYSITPLIIGQHGFSDEGNYADIENAYLGNYMFESGEKISDLILAAEASYGKGKVIVFGDTSSMQNPVLPYSHDFIASVFSYLNSSRYNINIQVLSSLLIIIILKNIFLGDEKIITIFMISLLLLNSTSSIYSLTNGSQVDANSKLMYIDNSHSNFYSRNEFSYYSIDGLIYSAYRNGYVPIVKNKLSIDDITGNNLLVLISPTKALSISEVNKIDRFLKKGGDVIISAGWKEKKALKNIMDRYEFNIEPIPIGPYPYADSNYTISSNEIQFSNSWAITCSNQFQKIYVAQIGNVDYNLIIKKKVGNGSLVIIGDDEFLLNYNLEYMNEYKLGNILFVKDLLASMEANS